MSSLLGSETNLYISGTTLLTYVDVSDVVLSDGSMQSLFTNLVQSGKYDGTLKFSPGTQLPD